MADRIPLDIDAINNTTLNVLIERKLCEFLGFEYDGSEIQARDQQVVIPKEKILKYFGADARSIYIGFDALNPIQMSGNRMDARSLKEEFGDRFQLLGPFGSDYHLTNN